MDFGKLLTETRKNQKISRDELTRRTGISQSVIAHYEERGGQPTLPKADALCRELGISITLGAERKSEPCKYCGGKYYIKRERQFKPVLEPLTTEQWLENAPGYEMIELKNRYCPVCGRKTEAELMI